MSRWALGVALAAAGSLAAGCGGKGAVEEGGCDPGFHACGADCAYDSSVWSCGTRCTPCPAPDGGYATCVAAAGGYACGLACSTGRHLCGTACADDSGVATCGTRCDPCPGSAPAHGRAACVAGACDYSCDLGWLRCPSGCCQAPRLGNARLAAGGAHTCGINASGQVKCWGLNMSGQVGNGSLAPRQLTPAAVTGSELVTPSQVAAAFLHSCGVDSTGGAWCWGNNGFAELGVGGGPSSNVPVEVLGVVDVLMVGGGWEHTCALLGGGTVRCWGNGERGTMGDGAVYGGAVPAPVEVNGVAGAYALLSGYQFNCAATGLAEMSCWGDNREGQLGNPAAGPQELAPVPATNLGGIASLRAVALGHAHACVAYDAPAVSGGVRCWGRGDSGQLGQGNASSATPIEVPGLSDVVALAAGEFHTCALTGSGAVWCWGGNDDGQLGNGTYTGGSTPVAASGLAPGAVGIAAGFRHTCALVGVGAGEELRCWGWNQDGQLGDGTDWGRPSPATVSGF